MIPVLASLAVGVGVKLGLGLAASAAKRLLEPASVSGVRRVDAFPVLLKSPSAAAPAGSTEPPRLASLLPDELPGRLVATYLPLTPPHTKGIAAYRRATPQSP